MSILNNVLRLGNFTSSEIWKLTKLNRKGDGFGEPAIRYIMETNDERMLGQSVGIDVDARAFSWGHLCESIVHEKLGLDYTFSSDITVAHPDYDYWVGSPDGTHEHPTERAVIDYKAPITYTSFIALVRPLYQGLSGIDAMLAIRDGYTHNGFEYPKHKDGEKYFYQLVSNACINNCNYAELIVFMPYQSQLIEINNLIGDDPRFSWIKRNPEQVPCLPDGGTFKNINIIRFEVPKSDKEFLTSQIIKASKLLLPKPTPVSV